MGIEHKPLPSVGPQWEEGRGFARLYTRDPHTQARFVKALIGFRAHAEWMHEEEVIEAADVVLRFFAKEFPEFLTSSAAEEQSSDIWREDYTPDLHMLRLLNMKTGVEVSAEAISGEHER